MQLAPDHDERAKEGESAWLIVSASCGPKAFALQRLDLGVEQLVVHGDLAHLGFQPGDLVVAVIAFTFFQGCSRAGDRTLAPLA